MRASIDIDDQLLQYVKYHAVEQGCTLKQIVENALRDFLAHHSAPRQTVRLQTCSGWRLKPGVDLDDNRRLHDIIESH